MASRPPPWSPSRSSSPRRRSRPWPATSAPSTRSSSRRSPRRAASNMPEVNVALIGYAFMGRAHSNAYRQVSRFFSPKLTPRLKLVCGRDPKKVARAAAQLGWEEWATDWREVVGREDIQVVDVVTPGDSHAEIAIAAAKAGKAVLCEKP